MGAGPSPHAGLLAAACEHARLPRLVWRDSGGVGLGLALRFPVSMCRDIGVVALQGRAWITHGKCMCRLVHESSRPVPKPGSRGLQDDGDLGSMSLPQALFPQKARHWNCGAYILWML